MMGWSRTKGGDGGGRRWGGRGRVRHAASERGRTLCICPSHGLHIQEEQDAATAAAASSGGGRSTSRSRSSSSGSVGMIGIGILHAGRFIVATRRMASSWGFVLCASRISPGLDESRADPSRDSVEQPWLPSLPPSCGQSLHVRAWRCALLQAGPWTERAAAAAAAAARGAV